MQGLGQGGVGGVKAAANVAQGNDASAREGGDVDDGAGLEARGVGKGVAQHQAAFGVGVEHFDGLAAQAGDHVARLGGAAAGQVFAGGNEADHVDGRLQLAQGLERAQHAGGAAHVELHFVHAGGGLDGDAAGVERDALAHQGHGRLALGRALVAQHDEAQLFMRAARHGGKCAHAELGHFLGAENFAVDMAAFFLGDGLGGGGQLPGRGVVGRAVAPLARQADAAGRGRGLGEGGFQCGAGGGGQGQAHAG